MICKKRKITTKQTFQVCPAYIGKMLVPHHTFRQLRSSSFPKPFLDQLAFDPLCAGPFHFHFKSQIILSWFPHVWMPPESSIRLYQVKQRDFISDQHMMSPALFSTPNKQGRSNIWRVASDCIKSNRETLLVISTWCHQLSSQLLISRADQTFGE